MAYFEGEIPVVTNGCYGNNGNNGWNDWSWIIGLALVGGLFGGWGNGGFGFGGGRGGYGYTGIPENFALQTDFATVERKLDSISNGICDSTFALNNTITNGNFNIINSLTQGFAGLNTALVQGFNGVDNAICTSSFQNQAGFNQIGNLIQSCCCDLKTMNLENRYLNEKQTCEIVNAINAGNQRLVDIYTSDKMASKDARIATLEAQISNDRQSRFIVDSLSPKCPVSAYVVQPPQQVTFPTNCCGNVAYASYNNGCGCGI